MKRICVFLSILFALFFTTGCEKIEPKFSLLAWNQSAIISKNDMNFYDKYIFWFKFVGEGNIADNYDTLNLNIEYTLEDGSVINSSFGYANLNFEDTTDFFVGVVYEDNEQPLFDKLSEIKNVSAEVLFLDEKQFDFNKYEINPEITYYDILQTTDDFGYSYYGTQDNNYYENNILLFKNKEREYIITSLLDISATGKEYFYGDVYNIEEEYNVEEVLLVPYVKGVLTN